MKAFLDYFNSLRGRRIAVLGLGVSNRPLVQLLLEFGCTVVGCDRTPRQQLDEKLEKGNVILDVEPNGAFAVRRERPDATLIFIMPPSVEELERRLRGRGDTSEEQIAIRMERAKWEMDQQGWYDYVVVNDKLDDCVREILNIIAEKAD